MKQVQGQGFQKFSSAQFGPSAHILSDIVNFNKTKQIHTISMSVNSPDLHPLCLSLNSPDSTYFAKTPRSLLNTGSATFSWHRAHSLHFSSSKSLWALLSALWTIILFTRVYKCTQTGIPLPALPEGLNTGRHCVGGYVWSIAES